LEQPSQSDIGLWYTIMLCQLAHTANHNLVGLGKRLILVILALGDQVSLRAGRACSRAIASQATRSQWAVGDYTDLLIAAERQHLALFLAVDQIKVVLHRDKARPAVLLRDVQRLLELPSKHCR